MASASASRVVLRYKPVAGKSEEAMAISATGPSLHPELTDRTARPIARRGHLPTVTGVTGIGSATQAHLVPEGRLRDRGPADPLIEIHLDLHSSLPNLFDRDQGRIGSGRRLPQKPPALHLRRRALQGAGVRFMKPATIVSDPGILATDRPPAKGSRNHRACGERLKPRLATSPIPLPRRSDLRRICCWSSGADRDRPGCEFEYLRHPGLPRHCGEGFRGLGGETPNPRFDHDRSGDGGIAPTSNRHPDVVAAVIRKLSAPDACLPTMGGQTP